MCIIKVEREIDLKKRIEARSKRVGKPTERNIREGYRKDVIPVGQTEEICSVMSGFSGGLTSEGITLIA